jgi:hypothetical protein
MDLEMTDTLGMTSVRPAGRGLAARVLGTLTSPRRTYEDAAARPRALGVLLVVLVAMIAPRAWIHSTIVGQRALVDQQLQTMEAFGQTVSDQQYDRMQQMAPYGRYFVAAGQLVGLPLTVLAISAILFAIVSGVLGGAASFRQVFAVVSYSTVVLALRTLFSTPLNYARESLSSPTTFTALFPFFEDNTVGARLFGSVDLFVIWWIVNLAIGIAVLYKQRTAPIAATLLVVYGIVALTIAAIRSVLAGA